MPTIADTLIAATRKLEEAGVETAALDARTLLEYAINVSRETLISSRMNGLENPALEKYDDLVRRRAGGEPVSVITGHKEFWGLPFLTTKDTLDPRPDSETLIETVLERFPDKDVPLRMLDLGAGTGCLLLSLLREYPNASGVGVDISSAALDVAEKNAKRLNVSARVKWRKSDWLESVEGKFDIIVSNPPYIASGDMTQLPREVRAFDPHRALDGGADGLDAYRTIISSISGFLDPRGAVFLEVGAGQAAQVKEILAGKGFSVVRTRDDLSGIPRCISAYYSTSTETSC